MPSSAGDANSWRAAGVAAIIRPAQLVVIGQAERERLHAQSESKLATVGGTGSDGRGGLLMGAGR